MARPIVTQEIVNEVADALVATGEEPSIITVQAQIGGGSYTTIKRYLDVWKQQQAQTPAVDVPASLAERGVAFVRDLWQAASDLAAHDVVQVRAEAQRLVAVAQQAQADAEAAMERVEQEVETLQGQVGSQAQTIADLRAALVQAQAQLGAEQARVEAVQQQAQNLRADLERQRADTTAGLAGELARIRDEVAQIRAEQRKE